MKKILTMAALVLFGLLIGRDGSAQTNYRVIHHFGGVNGAHPYGHLISTEGELYGMTAGDTTRNTGMGFSVDPDGSDFTTLHHFSGPDGQNSAYELPTCPPPVFKASGVFSEGSRTNFWAFISGPSPEDVAAFTVTGPSGTYDLAPILSYRRLGLIYFHGEESILEDGRYTFMVTDGLGRTASAVKDFAYDDTIPQVDPSTMIPENGAYVGTTTPTLSFDPAMGDDVYYQVYVEDAGSRAVWYSSPTIRNPFCTSGSGARATRRATWSSRPGCGARSSSRPARRPRSGSTASS